VSRAPAARAPATDRPRPGRPPSGARERLLEAGLEVLKADGYAGLTIAKAAARAGENKALIAYHFGSKQGLVAAVARTVRDEITTAVLAEVEGARTVEEIARRTERGLWGVIERDERLARVYFDLVAVAVVDPEARKVMAEMREAWLRITAELLAAADDAPPRARIDAAATHVVAGLEGLALERLARGDSDTLAEARELYVRGAAAAIAR
jgi:TetR/AcrR family transcriptional repressor of bet genes